MKVLIFCFILACASAAPLSPELENDLKWKSVDFDKDGKPDVVPLTPEFNNDLKWKSVDNNKDGQPDVTTVVEETKVADTPVAEDPSVAAKVASVAPLGYAINIPPVGSFVYVAPEPIVEAAPVVEESKVAFVPVVDTPAVETAPTVEVAPVADSVIVQAGVPAVETASVVDPIVEAAPVAEETKVADAPVSPVAETPAAVEATPEVELKVPEPVQDTPEIQEAKAIFFRLYEEAAAAAAAVDEDGNPTVNNDLPATERKTRQIVSYYNPSTMPYTLPAFFPASYPFNYRAGFPYTFPLVYPTVPTPVTAKNDRKKRQVAVLPSSQLYKDLIYKSVDVNQDGQPDKAVIATPQTFPYLPYTGYPYSAYYPYAYSFANGLHF